MEQLTITNKQRTEGLIAFDLNGLKILQTARRTDKCIIVTTHVYDKGKEVTKIKSRRVR